MSQEQVMERMRRIGSKKNFMRESQVAEMEENKNAVAMTKRHEGGVLTVELSLEPDKFDLLGSECRLDFDQFLSVMNDIADEEEDDWGSLRMKDQINIVRDRIIEETILKYAKEKYEINIEEFSGKDLSYIKRYDGEGRFLGEATVLTLTLIPTMGMRVY